MKFFKECKSRLQLVGGVLLSVMVLSSCNSEGGKESVQLSIGSDSSASSSKWDKATIRSNYALLFKAEDYQAGLPLKEEFDRAKSVLRLDDDYFTKLDFEDTSGDWIVQVRGYEEEDVTATESVRYGVHQTGISGSFQFRESGVTEVKVKIRPAGKHFPITGQLAHQRSTGSSCAFQLSMSGEQTANIGSRGYVADLQIYDGNGTMLGEMSQSAMQFDLMDYADKVKKLKVSLKVKTADPETSEKLPMQEFQVNCDPFLIATLQTLQDSDKKTFTLSPLLLKTQTPLVATQTPYDASHACSKQKGMLLVSEDNFSTCEAIQLIKSAEGYLILPKQEWDWGNGYFLGVREVADQAPTPFGISQSNQLSFETSQMSLPASTMSLQVNLSEIKQVNNQQHFSLKNNGSYSYQTATGCDALAGVKYQNMTGAVFQKIGNACEVEPSLRPPQLDASMLSLTEVLLNWQSLPNRQYNIHRKQDSSSQWNRFSNKTAPWQDDGLGTTSSYSYKIEVCNASSQNCSQSSQVIKAGINLAPVASAVQVSGSQTKIKVSWQKPSGLASITGYQISRQKSGASWEVVQTINDANTTHWTDSGLTAGKIYGYEVVATTADAESIPAVASVQLQPLPAAPTITNANKEAIDSVKVEWTALAGATSYELYQATTTTASAFQVATTTTTATTYGQHDLPADSYYYRVKGCNIAGCSALSAASSLVKIDISWTKLTNSAGWSARYGHSSVVFNGKMWVLGGYDGSSKNDVWSSADGSTWTRATNSARWLARGFHSSVVFNNKMWVLGGSDGSNKNDVWSSADGSTWTRATNSAGWSARQGHNSVVFNNKMWVLGGYDGGRKNDVWSSSDGGTWTKATDSAGWSARYGHSSVVFNKKIWVLGGSDGSNKNDVWSSSDGVNWTRSTDSAGWSGRNSHRSVEFNGKMWVLGGDAGGRKNDVWSSSDGVNWTQSTVSVGWSARHSHQTLIFNNKMWVIGGIDGGNKNDVWVSANASVVSKMQDSAGKAYGRSVLKLDTSHTLFSQSTRGACSTRANTLLVSADGFVNCDAVFVKKGGRNHVVIPKETWKLNVTYQIGMMTSIGAKPLKDVAGNVLSFTTNNETHDSTNAIKEFDVGGFAKLKGDDFHLDKDGKLWFYRNEGSNVPAYDANACKTMFDFQNVNSDNFMPETTSGGGRTLAKDILASGPSTYHYLVDNVGSRTKVRNIVSGTETTFDRSYQPHTFFYYLCGVEIPDRS